jgi:hypothetical protein
MLDVLRWLLARRAGSVRAVASLLAVLLSACASTEDNGFLGAVELGDDLIAPDVALDEELFVCRIQPEVLTRHSCASGRDGESGGCHDSRSALRLMTVSGNPPCNADGEITGSVPDDYQQNLDALRFSVQADPESSPLYLRPTARAAHPRKIFDESDPEAELIAEWITGAAP